MTSYINAYSVDLYNFCMWRKNLESVLLIKMTLEFNLLSGSLQFFLELMKVPRVESKLRVFSFKIQFHTQVNKVLIFLSFKHPGFVLVINLAFLI